MNKYIVEKVWVTEAGYRAVVIITAMGHRCGYVGIPLEHPVSNNEVDYDDYGVHGGVTYKENSTSYPVESKGLCWLGFDCAHYDDRPDPKYVTARRILPYPESAKVRDLEFCINECESLAKQLKADDAK